MKTYTEYEASDIKMDGFAEGEQMHPVHAFLLGQMLIIGITGFKPLPIDGDDKMLPVKRLIAQFLNDAQKSGISISKSELPAVFNAPDPVR